jgi:hypothetical protein
MALAMVVAGWGLGVAGRAATGLRRGGTAAAPAPTAGGDAGAAGAAPEPAKEIRQAIANAVSHAPAIRPRMPGARQAIAPGIARASSCGAGLPVQMALAVSVAPTWASPEITSFVATGAASSARAIPDTRRLVAQAAINAHVHVAHPRAILRPRQGRVNAET